MRFSPAKVPTCRNYLSISAYTAIWCWRTWIVVLINFCRRSWPNSRTLFKEPCLNFDALLRKLRTLPSLLVFKSGLCGKCDLLLVSCWFSSQLRQRLQLEQCGKTMFGALTSSNDFFWEEFIVWGFWELCRRLLDVDLPAWWPHTTPSDAIIWFETPCSTTASKNLENTPYDFGRGPLRTHHNGERTAIVKVLSQLQNNQLRFDRLSYLRLFSRIFLTAKQSIKETFLLSNNGDVDSLNRDTFLHVRQLFERKTTVYTNSFHFQLNRLFFPCDLMSFTVKVNGVLFRPRRLARSYETQGWLGAVSQRIGAPAHVSDGSLTSTTRTCRRHLGSVNNVKADVVLGPWVHAICTGRFCSILFSLL